MIGVFLPVNYDMWDFAQSDPAQFPLPEFWYVVRQQDLETSSVVKLIPRFTLSQPFSRHTHIIFWFLIL